MRINTDNIYITIWVFLSVASLIFNTMFGSLAALMFLLSGMVFVASDVHGSYRFCKENWILFLIPLWALMSATWSDIHVTAARSSVQLILTTAFAVVIASKVRLEILLRAMGFAMIIAMLMSFVSSRVALNGMTGEVSLIGIFDSKNFLATNTAMSIFVALSLLLNKKSDKASRILGGILIIISFLVLIKAKSFGAMLFVIMSISLSVALTFYQNINLHMSTRRGINRALIATFILVMTFIIFSLVHGTFDEFMYSIGKDPTLTGRTEIWEMGFHIIADNPLLGVGYQSLFYIGNAPAEEIWNLAHKASGVGFNFHNMYVDTTVELGVIGLLMYVFLISAFFRRLFTLTDISLGGPYFFAFSIFIFLFLQTFLEAGWLNQFTVTHFFICMAWVYLKEKRL